MPSALSSQLSAHSLPSRRWLTRAMTIEAVGGRRQLELLEREKLLTREYPGGLKHARYVRSQVEAVLQSGADR